MAVSKLFIQAKCPGSCSSAQGVSLGTVTPQLGLPALGSVSSPLLTFPPSLLQLLKLQFLQESNLICFSIFYAPLIYSKLNKSIAVLRLPILL